MNFCINFGFSILMFLIFFLTAHSTVPKSSAIYSFSPGGQYIMMTFDDGPDRKLTPKILDVLKKKNVHATFFVYGIKAMHNVEIIKRASLEGHDVSIHGWDNSSLLNVTFDKMMNELLLSSKIIFKSIHLKPHYMRPSNGITSQEINDLITNHLKMSIILWNKDPEDLRINNKKKIISKIVDNAKPGDIIRLHDASPVMLSALPIFIDQLHSQGYEFLTISEILKFPDDKPH